MDGDYNAAGEKVLPVGNRGWGGLFDGSLHSSEDLRTIAEGTKQITGNLSFLTLIVISNPVQLGFQCGAQIIFQGGLYG